MATVQEDEDEERDAYGAGELEEEEDEEVMELDEEKDSMDLLLGSSQTGPQNITWKPMDLRAMGGVCSRLLVSLRLNFPTWKMKLL